MFPVMFLPSKHAAPKSRKIVRGIATMDNHLNFLAILSIPPYHNFPAPYLYGECPPQTRSRFVRQALMEADLSVTSPECAKMFHINKFVFILLARYSLSRDFFPLKSYTDFRRHLKLCSRHNSSAIYLKAAKIRELLAKYGYSNAESILDEWSYFPGNCGLMPGDTKALADPKYVV
jgi:hypothetical protein